MNKYVFKLVTLVGFLLILLGFMFNAWTLNMTMPGGKEFTESSKIFQGLDLTTFGKNNFLNFDDTFANLIKIFAFILTGISAVSTITAFIDFSIPKDKKKILNVFLIILGALVSLCVILMFVFAIIFIKKNTITQDNGYVLKPIMENGFYFMIMGGFLNGLFSIYLSTSK